MAGSDGLTREEEQVVEEAADAIVAYERWFENRAARTTYRGTTADDVISQYVEGLGHSRHGEAWSRLIRAAARHAFGPNYGKPKPALPTARERALRFYDSTRPSGATLEFLEAEAA